MEWFSTVFQATQLNKQWINGLKVAVCLSRTDAESILMLIGNRQSSEIRSLIIGSYCHLGRKQTAVIQSLGSSNSPKEAALDLKNLTFANMTYPQLALKVLSLISTAFKGETQEFTKAHSLQTFLHAICSILEKIQRKVEQIPRAAEMPHARC